MRAVGGYIPTYNEFIHYKMLSLNRCKEILKETKEKGISYTDEQIKVIRDLLYQLANLQFQIEENNKIENYTT